MDYASFSPSNSFLDYNTTIDPSANAKYKKKYVRMKRLIKDMVFENASLCDQVSLLQEKIMIAKEERRFLLKKLYHFQAVTDMENQLSNAKLRAAGTSPPATTITLQDLLPTIKKPPAKKAKTNTDILDGLRMMPVKPTKKAANKQKKVVQPIPLDITGRPVFPIVLGGLTVHSIGEVVTDRSSYHTEDVIFPVGFCSSRVYGSLKDPEQKCVYTCKVLDGGSVPRFEIASDNDLDTAIKGSSTDQCHALLLRHINNALGMEVAKTQGKGNEFFGFSVPTIQNLIQSSTGIRKCPGYRTLKFEVNRTGENIDPSENDASLSYDALQRSIVFSKRHLSGAVIKEEPQDPMSNSLRDLLMTS